MNKNILKKCVEELKKDAPKIDYVLGMLETLIDIPDNVQNYDYNPPKFATASPVSLEENPVPDFLRPGPVGRTS